MGGLIRRAQTPTMLWNSISFEVDRCWSRAAKGWGLSLLVVLSCGAASSRAEAAWGPPPYAEPHVAPSPPDQTWLKDVPDGPGAAKHKVAVFVFPGDDVYQPVRAAVVRALRRKGLNVTATLQPVDSAVQYREMSSALKVGAFVDGEVTGEGAHQSVHIRVRSGVTGQHVAAVNLSGPTPKVVAAITRTFWNRVGSATMRACASASRPHPRVREPLRIEAGTSVDDVSIAAREAN